MITKQKKMDKFTVDLDQVLNDFEYSELTDQYNASRNATPSIQNGIIKHSITNVFHSLNEYLNTNITVSNVNNVDNNFTQDEENCMEDVNLFNAIDAEKSIKNTHCKIDEILLDVSEKINDSQTTFYEENEHKILKINDDETCTVKTAGNIDTECKHKDLGNTDGSKFGKRDRNDNTECNNKEAEENAGKNQCPELEIEVVKEVLDKHQNCNEISGVENKTMDMVEILVEPEDKNVLVPNKTVVKVGFDSVDLDDIEIHKLLEELEEEINLGVNEQKESQASRQLSIEEKEKNRDKDDFASVRDNIKAKENIKTRYGQDNGSIKENDENKCDETPITVPKKESETLHLVSETWAEKSTENKRESVQSLGKKTAKDSAETVKDDCLLRPQNLCLDSKKYESKRQINLIGDPGSTPYNNVYISKEISKPSEPDMDCSSSSSPTFSDADSSSASTVSAGEIGGEHLEQPKIAEITQSTYVEAGENLEINPTNENENRTCEIDNITCGNEKSAPSNCVFEIGTNSSERLLESDSATQEESVEVDLAGKQWLGKEAPLWIPDSDAMSCLHCDMKFTVLKRRHHCRACGLVLCSKCCHLRFRLEYLDAEARVCNKCHDILNKDSNSSSGSDISPEVGNSPSYRPNPNNPLEYCSTVSPLQQVGSGNTSPPAVMVPVSVLKRKGSNKTKSNKSVMFCDGIRPGSDLTNLDNDFNYNNTKTKKLEKRHKNLPCVDPETNTFIPSSENCLPPIVSINKMDVSYSDTSNDPCLVERLKNEQVTFAISVNLFVHVKIINMTCCINKTAWCFSTEGLINVGQDEIVILLEFIDEEAFIPKDIFYHINNLYNDATKGTSVKELGLSLHNSSNFLDSKNHAGFVYVRPTFQCLENVIKPKDPNLIGILIHRWEIPWAKLFPLRLILRLGAEYRYYPSPIISTRHRDSVFVEIGHTIINLLADFRNFSYTLPQIRGLTIHMEDKNTTVTIPFNRYDQVMKSINNSSDHILAFAGNFSVQADSHLVCIQDTQSNENCYSTHAINIHNKPRKITGASFIVFNGALKSSSGLTAKSNIVEDGLMIQVLPEHMQQIRDNLRVMKNHRIPCGCINSASDETVNIVWGESDINFNLGVVSAIDNMSLGGIPSIRVHNGKNHVCVNGNRTIRWTEVFIVQNGEEDPKNPDPTDISRISESIAKATCDALVKYLDLLVANNFQKIGIRTTLHVENVSYLAGSNGTKLPPIYMKSLDNELIPILHRITSNNLGDNAIVLELIFRILNV